MTCVIEFNIITTYMMIFQNKCIYIITSFSLCTIDVISLMYYRVFLYRDIVHLYNKPLIFNLYRHLSQILIMESLIWLSIEQNKLDN